MKIFVIKICRPHQLLKLYVQPGTSKIYNSNTLDKFIQLVSSCSQQRSSRHEVDRDHLVVQSIEIIISLCSQQRSFCHGSSCHAVNRDHLVMQPKEIIVMQSTEIICHAVNRDHLSCSRRRSSYHAVDGITSLCSQWWTWLSYRAFNEQILAMWPIKVQY